jgi:ABC-type uncharacterized transport system auxiliary subunit
MRQVIAVPTLALVVGALAGCGAARPSKYYQLEVPQVPSAAGTHDPYPVALLVGRLAAPHLYRDERIVYRTGPEQLGTYQYHRWAEPPTEMLEAILLRMLRASGRYRTVQSLRSNARGDYIIRGRLQNLEEVSGGSLAARVAFEIELYEIKTGTTVWSQFYSRDEPVTGKGVAEVVAALDRNVQRGLEQISAGLEQYFAIHSAK